MKVLGAFVLLLLFSLLFALPGGAALMLLTGILFPVFGLVGLGFWASVGIMLLGSVVVGGLSRTSVLE